MTSRKICFVVVVGYFPIISTKSEINKILRYLFKAVKFPQPLQFALNSGLNRQFLKVLRKKMANRSRIWVAESNREMREAIGKVNAKFEKEKVMFVESPITEENFLTQRRKERKENSDILSLYCNS